MCSFKLKLVLYFLLAVAAAACGRGVLGFRALVQAERDQPGRRAPRGGPARRRRDLRRAPRRRRPLGARSSRRPARCSGRSRGARRAATHHAGSSRRVAAAPTVGGRPAGQRRGRSTAAACSAGSPSPCRVDARSCRAAAPRRALRDGDRPRRRAATGAIVAREAAARLALHARAGRRASRVGGPSTAALAAGAVPEPPRPSRSSRSRRSAGSTRPSAPPSAVLLPALLASLVLFGVVTYLLGRTIVRTLGRLADAAERDRARPARRARRRCAAATSSRELGSAFNAMADQLELRLDELEARARAASARRPPASARRSPRRTIPTQLLRVIVETAVEATGAAGGVVARRRAASSRAAGDPGRGRRSGSRFPLARRHRQTSGSLVLAARDLRRTTSVETASIARRAGGRRARERAAAPRSSSGRRSSTASPGSPTGASFEETLAAELARAERFGGAARARARRPRRLQAGQRPLRPPGRRRRAARVRRRAARDRARDRPRRPLGRRGVRAHPARHRRRRRRPLAERVRAALARAARRDAGRRAISVTASFGVAAFAESARASTSSSPRPTRRSTRQAERARTASVAAERAERLDV